MSATSGCCDEEAECIDRVSCPDVCSPKLVYGTDAEQQFEEIGDAYAGNVLGEISHKPTFVITYFEEGPLGVNLHRRPIDGIVEVSGIVAGTPATAMDIMVGDELWAVGSIEMGASFIEKEAWQGIVEYIKQSARPLEVTWKRAHRTHEELALLHQISNESRRSSADEGDHMKRSVSTASNPFTPKSDDISPRKEAASELQVQDENKEVGDEAEADEAPSYTTSATYRILESLLSTLVKKPANGKDNYKNEFYYKYLLKEDRRLLRRGELTTPGATTLWMKSYIKKHVILLSDVLIITIPHMVHKAQCYVVEHIIDLQACKLRSNGQVFGGTLEGSNSQSPPPTAKDKTHSTDRQLLECAFQIIWPGGSLQLFADSKESKEVWVLNLFLAICARVGGDSNGQGQVLGWRHQYMLGTMHSAVLSHDEAHVRELVALCDAGQMEFSACIDASDEDGYTPLHYACIMRMHGIIGALHEAAADVTAPDHRGLTPMHWAAMQLDDYTLSLLCSHVFDLDLCDKQQRTPLYMACVEGRDVGGHTDNAALKRCVACMLTHQPNVNFYDQHGYTMIHYLAASWQYEALELLLQADADVSARVGRSGMTALHLACMAQPIKLAEGEAKRIIQGTDATASSAGGASAKEKNRPTSPAASATDAGAVSLYEKLNHPMGSTTLRTLLKAGARPNAKDSKGRTALHILAEPGRDDLWDLMELTDGVAVLLSFGARFDDSAALQGLKARLLGVSVEALVERWASLPVINGDALNLTLNHFKRGDAGTDSAAGKGPNSNSSESVGSGSRKGPSSPPASISGSAKYGTHSTSGTLKYSATSGAADAGGAGGKDKDNDFKDMNFVGYPRPVFPETPDKCSMCLFQFSLFRRAHHCRLCDALCCDDCSKKRCLIEYQQVRTCDSCYNRVMDLQEKKNRDDMLAKMKPIPKARGDSSKLYLENKAKLLAEASQDDNGEKGKRAAQGESAQTIAVMNETRDKLLERGEKLSRAQERSELMANQANDFAKMAKALNEQQKSRWF